MCSFFVHVHDVGDSEGGHFYYSLVCRCICDFVMLLPPQTDLADVDMEDDMKHIVSDEIRRFRQSYKVSHNFFSHPYFDLPCITLYFIICCVLI